MKRLVLGLVFLSAVACGGQTEWVHERLHWKVQDADPNDYAVDVNASGVPAYILKTTETRFLHAWRHRTDLNKLYLPPPSAAKHVRINDAGQVAYTALTLDSLHIMVAGHDYFADVYEPGTEGSIGVMDIDELGRPLWFTDFERGPWRVYRGAEDLSHRVRVGSLISVDPTMNRGGDAVWGAYHLVGGAFEQDVFLNDVNLSSALLGPNREIRGAAINDAADVLWAGKGDKTAGSFYLFLNDVNLTKDWITERHTASVKEITNSDHTLWMLYLFADGQWHLMKDSTDISTPVFGDHRYTVPGNHVFISETGDVVWRGTDQVTRHRAIYLNQEDISTPATGSANGGIVVGIDGSGNALWWGSGPLTDSKLNVFVNTFNLSRDAMPDGDYRGATALAIGESGHVLWTSNHGNHNSTYWLSTPVPEPSTLLLALPLLVLLRKRRSSRRRGLP